MDLGRLGQLAPDVIDGIRRLPTSSLRDTTRVAASSPAMWRDIFVANKDAVLEMLGRFNEDIALLTKAIRNGDGQTLHDHFARTRACPRTHLASR